MIKGKGSFKNNWTLANIIGRIRASFRPLPQKRKERDGSSAQRLSRSSSVVENAWIREVSVPTSSACTPTAPLLGPTGAEASGVFTGGLATTSSSVTTAFFWEEATVALADDKEDDEEQEEEEKDDGDAAKMGTEALPEEVVASAEKESCAVLALLLLRGLCRGWVSVIPRLSSVPASSAIGVEVVNFSFCFRFGAAGLESPLFAIFLPLRFRRRHLPVNVHQHQQLR